jgi:hypothetical protein
MSQGESKLSRDIMAALRANGVFCFKIHGGPTMMAGLPDIIACVPTRVDIAVADGIGLASSTDIVGRFVGFETKMPTGVVSPIQHRIHERIHDAAGIVFVVHSVAEAMDAWRTVIRTPTDPR